MKLLFRWRCFMDRAKNNPRELERKIEKASRIASTITDQTTLERLRRGWRN